MMWKHIRRTEEVNMEEILGIIRQYLTAINPLNEDVNNVEK